MPDINSHIDTVGGAEYITVCDVQSVYCQTPIAKKGCHGIRNFKGQIRP